MTWLSYCQHPPPFYAWSIMSFLEGSPNLRGVTTVNGGVPPPPPSSSGKELEFSKMLVVFLILFRYYFKFGEYWLVFEYIGPINSSHEKMPVKIQKSSSHPLKSVSNIPILFLNNNPTKVCLINNNIGVTFV